MDAESRRRRRESSISLREQRWSMSSQRLEQIVAALMKPVSHYGQSFDRDDSGLLEEYLTAAGLRALEAAEAGRAPPPHNYAELGLVIQSFANNYCKKVDHLSRLVATFSQALHDDSVARSPDAEAELSCLSPEAGAGARAGARRRLASAGGAFAAVQLEACGGARRDAAPAGPPPTLPRGYAELQPRAAAAERALVDYAGEPIGSLDDFRLAWRLHNGFLVEELESGPAGCGSELRPLSLVELQQACARAAAPLPPPAPLRTPSPASPRPASPPPASPRMPPPTALTRKRRSEVRIEELLVESFDMDIDEVVHARLSEVKEFSVSERWIRRVVRHRRDRILCERRRADPPPLEFRGFDMSWMDIGGFAGWTAAEAAQARALAAAARRPALDSDDDGFYERSSSLGGSSRLSLDHSNQVSDGIEADAEAERRTRQAAAPLRLAALARDVRRALPPPPAAATWRHIAHATRHSQPQPARVLLDILMKASRGEVAIEQGEPLSVGDFSVRVLSEEVPPPAMEDEEWLALMGTPPPPDER